MHILNFTFGNIQQMNEFFLFFILELCYLIVLLYFTLELCYIFINFIILFYFRTHL